MESSYVVGIIHTNYTFYARGEKHGRMKKPIVKAACAFTVRAHCHRVIKLSDTLQEYAKEKEMVENVHGVSGGGAGWFRGESVRDRETEDRDKRGGKGDIARERGREGERQPEREGQERRQTEGW